MVQAGQHLSFLTELALDFSLFFRSTGHGPEFLQRPYLARWLSLFDPIDEGHPPTTNDLEDSVFSLQDCSRLERWWHVDPPNSTLQS